MEKMCPLPLDTFGIAGHFFKGRTMDYYIRYPDKPDGAYCSGCHTLKPIADFTRRATLSESRNWTKNPELKRPILYEGKLCNGCQKRRKPSDLSPEELRKRLVNEGANPLKIQAKVEAHYAKGKASRKQKQTKARAERYEAQYQAMLKDTAEQLRKTSEHLRYARRSSKPDDYIENLEEKTHALRSQRNQIKAARLNGRDPTSLCASTQNPAVPLSTSKGE
jgi:hypothetical protein